ncbi:MAG TPA: hypothetical protein VHX38_36240 [Pseudonocardiaceae bacterium]|nr:hypothetical protein [Pseudonocardiaceae bacterium]
MVVVAMGLAGDGAGTCRPDLDGGVHAVLDEDQTIMRAGEVLIPGDVLIPCSTSGRRGLVPDRGMCGAMVGR